MIETQFVQTRMVITIADIEHEYKALVFVLVRLFGLGNHWR